MTNGYDFTEYEIRKKLEELGYSNIPAEKLRQFQSDLKHLIESEKSELGQKKQSQDFQASASDSYYTDSYLVGTEDQTSATSPEVSNSSKERDAVCKRFRSPVEDSVVHRARSGPTLTKAIGKENAQYYKKAGPIRVESSSTIDSSPQEPNRPGSHKGVKRKVLRRRNGEPRVFDESMTSSESVTDISDLEQRLRDLPIHNSESDDADVISVRSDDSTEPRDYRPWEHRAGGALPSFIRPSNQHPHTRQIRKTDPVSRYHQFKYEWQANKAPGEKSHKNLRWNVRGKMLQCDVFERPQRSFAPNNYVVPTEKKRQALRWEVRSSLARM